MKAKSGYTLIELLVVLAIVALLAGLIVSVMAPARAKSKEVACISNLHQIGQGLRLYMEDYDAKPAVQGMKMTPYELGLPPGDNWTHPPYGAHIVLEKNYIGSNKVLYCPDYHGKNPIQEMGSTYETHLYWRKNDIDHAAELIAKRGELFSLLVCHEHFPGNPFALDYPPGQKRKVNILRLNLQIDSKMYPMPPLAYDY